MRMLCLALLLLLPTFMRPAPKDSIYVNQFVKDAFTRYGIKDALVTVTDAAGNVIDTVRTAPGNGSHDAQMWQLRVPRHEATFRIRAEHPDYAPGEMTVELKRPGRLNAFRFPDMLLERRFEEKNVNLGEATVSATRVKLCYKGDTIEVNAAAFRLGEGSMLESLVRSVPGCELRDDGDIYMNGRKVDYLTLNGKDFFKGNNRIMLDNLPYYTVDKLQFFNRRSVHDELTGRDGERPDFVMNVNLKQEYNIGYMGNVEAGGGTQRRWTGRGFALRFTDNSRLSLFANANNINETRSGGADGGGGLPANPEGDIETRSAGGEWLVDDKWGRYKEVLNASLSWSKAKEEYRTASQQFLQSGDVFGYEGGRSTKRNFALRANNNLTFKRIGLVAGSRFDYSRHDDDGLTRSALFAKRLQAGVEQVIDSIFGANQSSEMRRLMVNNVEDAATNSGRKWTAEQTLDYHKSLPWGDDLMLTAKGLWNETADDGDSRYRLRYADGATPADNRVRLTDASSRASLLELGARYAFHFLSGWHLALGLAHSERHSRERSDLYRPDLGEGFNPDEWLPSLTDDLSLCDADNSPHSVGTRREEHITGQLHRHDYDSRRGRYFSFTTALDAHYVGQDGDYSRGEKRVGLSDYRWLFNPTVDVEYQTRNWHETYRLHYDTKMQAPNLARMADLTDTSDPLAVQMGNPDLRPSTTHTLSLLFHSRFGTHGQFVMLRSDASVMQNLVAMNTLYDEHTGAYTYIPVNVDGNWYSNNSIDFRRALTTDRRLNMESRTSYKYMHSVDMKDNATSTVVQHGVGQQLKLEYKQTRFTLALSGGLSWNGMRVAAIDDINSVDFNYGATLQADLPLKIRLSTDIKMYSRRGYADPSMCTDNLLWNARIDRSFCRGRLLVAAQAFDLLHRISSTHTTYNAQARTETWRLSLPSYLMLTVQLRLNKNPEKRQ